MNPAPGSIDIADSDLPADGVGKHPFDCFLVAVYLRKYVITKAEKSNAEKEIEKNRQSEDDAEGVMSDQIRIAIAMSQPVPVKGGSANGGRRVMIYAH
ncbi:MAG: hypothetical protein K0S28_1798 [Paucimonas sp.]|nr:hypothetical protein [Paucimonas sp.]